MYLRPREDLHEFRDRIDELKIAMAKISKRVNDFRNVGQRKCLFVIDFKNARLGKILWHKSKFVPLAKFAFTIYREWNCNILVVNGGMKVKMLFAFAKMLPFIDRSVWDNVINIEKVKELEKRIDIGQLPGRYGGNGTLKKLEEHVWLNDEKSPEHVSDFTPFWKDEKL